MKKVHTKVFTTILCLSVLATLVFALSLVPARAQEGVPATPTSETIITEPIDSSSVANTTTTGVTENDSGIAEEVSVVLPDFSSTSDFLAWLLRIGLVYAVNWVMSFLADKQSWWSKVPHDIKVISPMIVAIAIAVGGNILLSKFPEILTDPVFNGIGMSLLGYLAMNQQHKRFDSGNQPTPDPIPPAPTTSAR